MHGTYHCARNQYSVGTLHTLACSDCVFGATTSAVTKSAAFAPILLPMIDSSTIRALCHRRVRDTRGAVFLCSHPDTVRTVAPYYLSELPYRQTPHHCAAGISQHCRGATVLAAMSANARGHITFPWKPADQGAENTEQLCCTRALIKESVEGLVEL